MKSEEENNEFDINEVAITLKVDSDVIDKVRSGEITHLVAQIKRNHLNLIFEDTLIFLLLDSGDDECLTTIIDVDTEPGTRFNYQGAGKTIVEDPNDDSCIWEVAFEVVPVPDEPKTYLMRWNPTISSFTEEDFEECVANKAHGLFRMNWSIFEWEEARRGDLFFMMRVGDNKAGIVFTGQFISDPYPSEDWAGSNKRRMYVDMIVTNSIEPGESPRVSLDKLNREIPAIEWSEGHSGVLLSDEVAAKLEELCDEDEEEEVELAN